MRSAARAYHRAIRAELDDVAALLGRTDRAAPGWLLGACERMRAGSGRCADRTGACRCSTTRGRARRARRAGAAREAVTVLRESGYVVLRHAGDQLVVDAGPVAPRHLPPHAHADVLSFVLWADGRPLVVDPGSFTYTGPLRDTFRGTAAHNTVEVDGTDQCELWGDFRAAFLPRVARLDISAHADLTIVAARHDGYRRLSDPVVHERWFCWIPRDGLVVVDVLHARRAHRAISRLHLAPGVPATGGARVGPFALQPLGAELTVSVTAGAYAPYLGVQREIEVIELAGAVPPGVPFGWALLRPGAEASLEGTALTLTRRDGARVTLQLR